jgi:hypothetical protein
MKVLKSNNVQVKLKGNIMLVDKVQVISMPATYRIHSDGRMAITGFSTFAKAAQLTVGSEVVITIETSGKGQEMFSLVFLYLNKMFMYI